ncbi:hypothetical protein [Sphingobium yanoikuyae]|uniref:hypothetical protein n=1 Tax=Sphingobium yanoikuyae TaxID=13690 RepID=UPI0028ACD149|nr:hypothetical protein [Sphingobium yanoikuyae]
MTIGTGLNGLDSAVGSIDYWIEIDSERLFAQGDILRSVPSDTNAEPTFGLIITADCDIVQSKAADRLTYVEVVTTRDYLERVWIPDQLQKYVKKQAKGAAEELTGLMRRSGLELAMSVDQLLDWLRERPVESIDKAVNRTGKALDAKLLKTLTALRCALGADANQKPLGQWRALRDILGEPVDRQSADLAAALAGGGGFPDFFLLPELPRASEFGYVALLRFIRTVHADGVFKSEVDARIQGQPQALHRVGRLTDGIRFAITQKLAFLFSRIGLPSHYEDACKSAATLAAESLVTGA